MIFKGELKEKILKYFEPYKEKKEYYLQKPDEVRDILRAGAEKARERAIPVMEKVREAVGVL